MKTHVIAAAKTIAVVLVGIYILRKVPVANTLVSTALNG